MTDLAALMVSLVCGHWLWSYWVQSKHTADEQLASELAHAQETIYLLRGVMESQESATLIADPTGKIIECTASFERRMGYHRGELAGRNVNLFVPEHMREQHDEWLVEFYRERGELEIRPVKALNKQGESISIALGLSKTKPINNAPLLVATIREVDEEQHGLGRHAENSSTGGASAAVGAAGE